MGKKRKQPLHPEIVKLLAANREVKKFERSNAAKILRRFAKLTKVLGYTRKGSFFAREREHIVQFLHLHKFSFGGSFRMHTCLRVLNSDFGSAALIGMTDNSDYQYQAALEYENNEESLLRCVNALERYVTDISEPWFEIQTINVLLSEDSCLPNSDREALRESVLGKASPERIAHSRSLLGL